MTNIQSNPTRAQTTQKPRGRGCLWGCIGILGIFLFGGICILISPFVLSAIGFIGQPADIVYGAAPDPYASAQIQETFDQASIEGVRVYVIPEQGSNNQTAFIILDSAQGFDGFTDLEQSATEDVVDARVDAVLVDLAERNRKENLRIVRVAIDYRDEMGESFMRMTTPMSDVEDYLAGNLSKEEFYGDFGVGLGDVVNQLLEEYLNE
jgi:hypothetical protein